MNHRSVSQFGTFIRCGEQYRLTKVEGAPQRPAAWFIQGTAFHAAVEEYERSFRSISTEEAKTIYREAWAEAFNKEIEREPNLDRWLTGGRVKASDDIMRRLERGAMQVEHYISYAEQAEWKIWEFTPDFAAVELPFTAEFGGVEVVGYIDQVVEYPNGALRVRDLKTGTKLPSTPFQLGVYDHAMYQLFGVKIGWGDYYMAKNNAPTNPYDLSYYTKNRLDRWFANMDKAVKLGLFIPNPSDDNCRTCTVPDFCDAGGPRAAEYPPHEIGES